MKILSGLGDFVNDFLDYEQVPPRVPKQYMNFKNPLEEEKQEDQDVGPVDAAP